MLACFRRHLVRSLGLLQAAWLALALGCQPTNPPPDDVQREVEAAPQTSGESDARAEEFRREREQFMARMREELSQLDEEMELASAKAEGLTEEAREDWGEQRDELAVLRNRLQEDFEGLSQSTVENWEELHLDFQNAYDQLRDQIDRLTRRIPEPQLEGPTTSQE